MATGSTQVVLVGDDGSCNPSPVVVTADTGVIIWAMAAGTTKPLNAVTINAPWSGPQPSPAMLNGSQIFAVGDNDNVTEPTSYEYSVTVGGVTYDPEIDNIPPNP